MTEPASGLWAPRYWSKWLAYGAWRCLAVLPFGARLRVGAAVGRAAYYVGKRRREIARTNFEKCFPELSESARESLLHEHCAELGIALAEIGAAYWGSDSHLPAVNIIGFEHVETAGQSGRGVLLIGAHLLGSEMVMRVFASRHPVGAVFRPNNNPLVERVITGGRRRHAERMIPRGDIRQMVRTLKAGKVLWFAPDQDHGPRHSVFVPFFGHLAATITAPARLARLSGAAVLTCFPRRLAGTQGYELIIEPAFEQFPSDDPVADAARVNAAIEQHVRRCVPQYLWVHRRFKTRPEDEPSFYPPKR